MYSAVIFDFFDVIRTDPYKAWLKKHGLKREGVYDEVAKPLDRGDLDLEGFFDQLEEISGHSSETVRHEYENSKLVDPEILEVIRGLKKHYKVGLLSNADQGYIRGLLKQHDLEKLFDVIAISAEVGLIKPSKEAFLHILDQLGAKPEETIFIDDSEHNVKSANELGIDSVHFKDVETLKNDLTKRGVDFS